ncbi:MULTISPECIES: DUF4258 domain-containing protein [unclassified Acidovorax]|jgi:hypothetical protein|uniref:DUF4258 domain-containing protein n=1 Tax=unclassified Acidovorax TaxID=2684926 RepID=UPI001C496192|nr:MULTISPECIES: DUF4258 domain-containing protein [unclassified Acidovorax]MBV7460599.1 DUF4258 domain-containing protein [Acidovorax sp. sif0632]MBV7465624.1 DUF4258 domain-containing protein [Acidovorax sp. sif0613]
MGYEKAIKLSNAQLEKRIRSVAEDSANVVITVHAKARMRERKVNVIAVYEALRKGTIKHPPEPNLGKQSLECRMEHYTAGKNVCVVVALSDENPLLVCVTVFYCD